MSLVAKKRDKHARCKNRVSDAPCARSRILLSGLVLLHFLLLPCVFAQRGPDVQLANRSSYCSSRPVNGVCHPCGPSTARQCAGFNRAPCVQPGGKAICGHCAAGTFGTVGYQMSKCNLCGANQWSYAKYVHPSNAPFLGPCTLTCHFRPAGARRVCVRTWPFGAFEKHGARARVVSSCMRRRHPLNEPWLPCGAHTNTHTSCCMAPSQLRQMQALHCYSRVHRPIVQAHRPGNGLQQVWPQLLSALEQVEVHQDVLFSWGGVLPW